MNPHPVYNWCAVEHFLKILHLLLVSGSGHHFRVGGGGRQDPERGAGEVRGGHHRAARGDRPLHLHRGPLD
jgi:hypothetical protein